MMRVATSSAIHKAHQVNFHSALYGTFAEIGAGQEVARYFFQAGGASQTIAKSISAYDMTFSDTIYGREEHGRYVCQSRLGKMLDYEYQLLTERLDAKKDKLRFFVLANTVATRTYFSNNDGHGWMGVKFQASPLQAPSQIVLHLRLLDNDPLNQQEALGVLGVNLVHAAAFDYHHKTLLDFLMENLTPARVEINMVELSGPLFSGIDNRLLNLELVKRKLTNAIMFDDQGKVVLAADVLYKKNIHVVRGSYRPPTKVNEDMISCGLEAYSAQIGVARSEIESICEITISNLESSSLNSDDFLARVDLIACLGHSVLITNFPQYYKLVSYFFDLKATHIALILGGYNFKQIFDESYIQEAGGVFAALGQLFKERVKVYVYPYRNEQNGESIDLENLDIPKHWAYLVTFLKENSSLLSLTNYDDSILHIFSRKVVKMIQEGEDGWQHMVPAPVAKMIQQRKLFQRLT